jgi:hypothetical protein
MKSKTRQDCEAAEALFAGMLMSLQDGIKNLQMLVVGVAGNPLTNNGKPGLDNPHWYPDYNITTLDFDPKWQPDIVGDITKPKEWWEGNYYDLVHITQVIEHIPNIMEVSAGLKTILNSGGYVIVDSPWGPNSPDYHGELPSFGDYWRISKDGMRALFQDDFDIIQIIDTDANTSCLMKAKV